MKNTGKKIKLTIWMCLIFIFSSTMQVHAIGSYTINGVTVRYTDFSSSPNECWAYANNIYKKIWGVNFTSSFDSNDNMLRNLSDGELTLTLDHLKSYVSKAALGSCLRICNSEYLHGNDGWGHSQVIVQKDENGFTVLEGGLSAEPYCREKYYTWSEYCNTGWLGGTYEYIKYIKWPGAADTVAPTISNYQVSDLSKDGFTVSCTINDNVGISHVDFLVWPDANGEWNNTVQRANISGNTASCYVKTSEHNEYEGNYAVHVQAYDTAGNMTYGQFDWIYVDKTGPVISDCKVYNKSSDGFDVSCTVTDNTEVSYVDFLVWPDANGEWNNTVERATISGDTASCHIKTSEHNEYEGNYAVHVQAYDSYGNMTYGYFDWIYIDRTAPIISDVEIVDVSESGYTVKCKVADEYSDIDRVQFPTWFEEDNPFNADWSWETSEKYSGKLEDGKYIFRVNASDYKNQMGKYHTHIYAWDEYGNRSECYETETLIKNTHKHVYTSNVKKPATCTEPGIMLYICEDKDDSYEEEIPATGHQHTELRNKKEATCIEEGYTGDTYCTDCETKISSGKVLSKIDHTWDDGKITQNANCITKGIKTFTCIICKSTRTEEIPATGHVNKITKFAKEATCKSEGYTGDIYCQDCGNCLEEGREIPKLKHKWDSGKITMAATCTVEGIKVFTCTDCGTTKEEAIAATGHGTTEIRNKRNASCTSEGYTGDIYCTTCNQKISSGSIVSKTKHSWDSVKVTKQPTTTETGVRTYTCQSCGATRKETIAKLKSQMATPGMTIKDKSTNGIYKVQKDGVSVEFTKLLYKKASARIPDTIKVNGAVYKVTEIAANAFKNNTSLKSINIGKNITVIGTNAFYGCKKLSKVSGGNGIVKIGHRAFANCGNLGKIVVSGTVKNIGKQAFYNCKKLKSIIIKTSTLSGKTIGSKAFTGTYKKPTIKVPAKQMEAYKKLLKSRGMNSQAIYKK